MTEMTRLHPGDRFPALTVALPGGRGLRLPDDLAGRFGVVLFYRGSWCPYRNAQLSAFQRSLGTLADLDVSVMALSAGDEAATVDLIARHGLTLPAGHSADATADAEATGAFVNPDPPCLQSAGCLREHAPDTHSRWPAPRRTRTRSRSCCQYRPAAPGRRCPP